MMRANSILVKVLGGVSIFLCAARGQSRQAFEVASIHPAANDTRNTRFDMPGSGRLSVTSVTLRALIRSAWMIQDSQVAGGPGWLDSDRYDIEAKSGGAERIDNAELQRLLQSLLADRFKLQYHWETREQTVYALVADGKDKAWSHLAPNTAAKFTTLNTRDGSGRVRIAGTRVTMEQLARSIGNVLGRIVVDKTGVPGGYDLDLEWDVEPVPDSLSPSVFTVLREKLGLRLETQKAPVKVLVVDHAEKASEN
jgi:uncharacterized protein (TIGR03435 family)